MDKVQASWRVFKLNSLPFCLFSLCVRGIDYISKYFSKLISHCILCFFNPVYTHQNRDCFLSSYLYPTGSLGLHRWPGGKESSYQHRRCKRGEFSPWVRKMPWSRKWQPTPVFLPGKSHGQRKLSGYSPWDRRAWRDGTRAARTFKVYFVTAHWTFIPILGMLNSITVC